MLYILNILDRYRLVFFLEMFAKTEEIAKELEIIRQLKQGLSRIASDTTVCKGFESEKKILYGCDSQGTFRLFLSIFCKEQ